MGYPGRVIGIDIAVRPNNRRAIESHNLGPMITLIEGDSVAEPIVAEAAALIRPDETVMVILDSNHAKMHVEKELEAYAPLVTKGSYIVATDGIMGMVCDTPRGESGWLTDNPTSAANEFAARHPEFVLEQPKWKFNEGNLDRPITAWPNAWLKRVR
jgi:cephalosporin hydroxylase